MSPADARHLMDRAALHDLVMTYCRATDRRDYGLLRSLYHDDAVEDRAGVFSGPVDEWITFARQAQTRFEITILRMSNTLFVIDGDQAQGEHYAEAYHRTHGPDAHEVFAGGRYIDRYEKRAGVWKLSYRTATSDRAHMQPVDKAAYEQFSTYSAKGRTDAEDLSYKVLTLFPPHGGG